MASLHPRRAVSLVPVALAAVVMLGWHTPVRGETPGDWTTVQITGIPHVRQKPDFCGEACIEMYARKLGKTITQDDAFNASGLDPAKGRGCYAADLNRALKALGFETGSSWTRIDAKRADDQLREQFANLHRDLVAGVPSIVCMKYNALPDATEHFRLVTGYDAARQQVIYQEPAEDNGQDRRMSLDDFLELWPLKYDARRWTVVRFTLKPQRVQSIAGATGFTDADYAQHVLALRRAGKLPEGMSVVIEKPFVVIGNEGDARVKQRAEQTVRWSVNLLRKAYFEKDPDQIISIYLFKDKPSYEKHCRELFNINAHTPFGFYTDRHKAMVMNIATGGGTLVHEIVHPFMASNFPKCPAWFNEGLASLYEQAAHRDGHIIGRTNWRLAGLQRAIKADRLPSFRDLTGTTTHQFYNDRNGTNYAQARYLCYYLQETNRLHRFYREFVANHADDPTGYQTLVKVLGADDMEAFDQRWRKWVMKLKFP